MYQHLSKDVDEYPKYSMHRHRPLLVVGNKLNAIQLLLLQRLRIESEKPRNVKNPESDLPIVTILMKYPP